MNDSDTPDESDAKTDRLGWLAWGIIVAIGVAAYELFHQPALLGATISLKFAWGDARTGFWLRARDPNRRRGTANFWVYLGYGLWKAAICGFLLTFVFAGLELAIHGKAANRPAGPRNETLVLIFAGTCGGSFFTALSSGAICCTGFTHALRSRSKLWLNSRVAACRVRDIWPPEGGDRNDLSYVALPSALLGSALFVSGIAIVIATLVANNVNPQAKWVAIVVTFTVMILMPVLALILNDWVKKHVTALSPSEAWPDGESGS